MTDTPGETDGDEQGRSTSAAALEAAVGMPIPDEHVGAFVAEVFEDAERSMTWQDVVDAMVAPEAREAWDDLTETQQVAEVLNVAANYDERAADALEAIEVDSAGPDDETKAAFREARRLRRNADGFRDGVASAYDEGHVDDEGLVTAIERIDFDSQRIARREDELERVTAAYDFDYRPYGGTLIQDDEAPARDPDVPETF